MFWIIFSLMVLVSFKKFIFTDIAFKEKPNSRIRHMVDLTSVHVCSKCKTLRGYFFKINNTTPYIFIKRQDIIHCKLCNCCVEYASHHCDFFRVCLCAKNYKYYIMGLFYCTLLFSTAIASLITLNLNWLNEDIEGMYLTQSMGCLIFFAILTLVCIGLIIIFLGESPLSQPKEFEHITAQLEYEMPENTHR